MLNLEGGIVLLGVEDNGRISGLTKSQREAEEWPMNITRNNLQPPTVPVWTFMVMKDGNVVGIVELPADSPGKPHKAKCGKAWVTYTRVGRESREATREEEGRLYQAARLVRYEIKAYVDSRAKSVRNYVYGATRLRALNFRPPLAGRGDENFVRLPYHVMPPFYNFIKYPGEASKCSLK